jgi:hypothetical protein
MVKECVGRREEGREGKGVGRKDLRKWQMMEDQVYCACMCVYVDTVYVCI